jgi:hypothetical protein
MDTSRLRSARALLACCAIAIAGCGGPTLTRENVYSKETFAQDNPFSKTIRGSSNVVCWSVKRALLSQGYILEQNRERDASVMVGTKDTLSHDDTTVTLKLQVTCSSNSDGSSTVFATGVQEVSKVQSFSNSVSAGVSLATVTLPSNSGRALTVVQRETIRDRQFYERFYGLVERIAGEESAAR